MLEYDEEKINDKYLSKKLTCCYAEESTHRWRILNLPNTSIGFSFGAEVSLNYRGSGLGQEQHKVRLTEAKNYGCSYMLCTVNKRNEIQKHILKKNGWKFLAEIPASMSSGSCLLFGKELECI